MTTSEELLKRFERMHPRSIDLSLGRTEALLEKLGNPQDQLKSIIHVAGTNGKGSVCAFLSAIFQAAGCRVAVFISPHLVTFHERIQLPDDKGVTKNISESNLVDVLRRAEEANAGKDITFYEITTCAAFLAFAENLPDILILETGLGGRLDSTNVIKRPAVSVITPVSMDHKEFLGDTLKEIAAEKAGILKRGSPAVIARQKPAAMASISVRAKELNVELSVAGMDWDCFSQHGRLLFQRADTELIDLPLPALLGTHQVQNAGVAIAAATTASLPPVSREALAQGLKTVSWPARMQPLPQGMLYNAIKRDVELWLDGGHNTDAGMVVSQAVAELDEKASKSVYLICGMMGNKDAVGYLAHFKGLARHVYTVPITSSTAGHSPAALADHANEAGLNATPVADVFSALKHIDEQGTEPARVLICGSLYLAGEVLRLNALQPES